mgnify:CR=1 FL=1
MGVQIQGIYCHIFEISTEHFSLCNIVFYDYDE